jgi:hypothetical protein
MKPFGWEQAGAFTCMIRLKKSSNHSIKFLPGRYWRSVQTTNIISGSSATACCINIIFCGALLKVMMGHGQYLYFKSGVVWAATNNGILKKYNRAANNFESYDLSVFSKDGEVNGVRDIYPLEDSAILVGTFTHAYAFNTRHPGLTNIFEKDAELNHVQVHSFIRYSASEIWIGTETGLYIYNTVTGKGRRIQKQYNNPYSITDNVVFLFIRIKKEEHGWVLSSAVLTIIQRSTMFLKNISPTCYSQ